MKIVYCLSCTCNPGGMERIVIQKANWLAKIGHEIVIVTTEQKGRSDYFYINSKIRKIDLGINYGDNAGSSFIKYYKERRKKISQHRQKLNNVLERELPDVTISTFGNEVEFLHLLKSAGKTILEIHFSRWFRIQANVGGIRALANRYLTYRDYNLVKKYDAFVCLTKEDSINWKGVKNLYIIPNFTDITPLKKLQSAKNVIAIGRLTYQKGYDRLIKAWKDVHKVFGDWKLDIYGNGDLKASLEKQILELDLRDTITIHEPSKYINKIMSEAGFLVLSSHFEGLPMVMLEALRCGLPVVSFDYQCGPKDIIDSTNGIIVKDNDIKGLSEAMVKIIGTPSLRFSLSKGASISGAKYTPEVVMPQWEALLTELANAN